MLVSSQLKHIVVLLKENGNSSSERLIRLLKLTPVKAEIAGPKALELIELARLLRLIKKSNYYYGLNFEVQTSDMGSFSEAELVNLRNLILNNAVILDQLPSYCSANGKFNYNSNDLLHRLLFELGFLNKKNTVFFLSDTIFKKPEISERIWKFSDNIESKELGLFAEKIIFFAEQKKLSHFENLVDRLVHVSLTNDSLGYDIKSCEPKSGKDLYLEVKGTRLPYPEFFLTSKELGTAKKLGTQYKLIIICGIKLENRTYDRIIEINNPAVLLYKHFKLTPQLYRVTKR